MSKHGTNLYLNSEPGYLATAFCHIGDFQGGECFISLSVNAITVCARSGKIVGTWPYNAIRDFSCRDDNFSFTSGRRGPFGVGTYQFQLRPSTLVKLTSAITVITGTRLGSKALPQHHQEDSEAPNTPPPTCNLYQPERPCTPPGQDGPASGTLSPQLPHANGVYDRLTRPFNSSCPLTELKQPRDVVSHPQKQFNKQMSSPELLRQRRRAHHHYEEIDLPASGKESANMSPLTTSPLVTACYMATPSNLSTNNGHTSQQSSPLCSDNVHCLTGMQDIPSGCISEPAVYENTRTLGINSTVAEQQSTLERDPMGLVPPDAVKEELCCPHQDVAHSHSTPGCNCSSTLLTTHGQTPQEEIYDTPCSSLYSVPAGRGSEMLTLNARRGHTHIPPLAFSQQTSSSASYCNVLSSQVCHVSGEAQDGDIYEEVGPKSAGTHLQYSSPGLSHISHKLTCTADVIARQLAAKEGYELVTSRSYIVPGYRCVLERQPENPYTNEQLDGRMSCRINGAREESEDDEYVTVQSPSTPYKDGSSAGDTRKQHLVLNSIVYQVPGACGMPLCMNSENVCGKIALSQQCAAF